MSQCLIVTCMSVWLMFASSTEAQVLVRGVVKDVEVGTALEGANVRIEGTLTGTVTDLRGWFSLEAWQLPSVVEVSYVG